MKRRKHCEKPTSKQNIKKDIDRFIKDLPGRYKDMENGYRVHLYRLLTECANLSELAAEEPSTNRKLRKGPAWNGVRQPCPEGEFVKLAVHHMLRPNGQTERAKASKYVAVIDYLFSKGKHGNAIFEAFSDEGGVENIYAITTGRQKTSVARSRSCEEKPDDVLEGDLEDDDDEAVYAEGTSFEEAEAPETVVLEVVVKQKVLVEVLSCHAVMMRLNIGGSLVEGKPKGFKLVTGKITEIID